jgi:hypothetical protein
MDFTKSLGLFACVFLSTTPAISQAYDQGFYVGGTVSRVKQNIERGEGIGVSTPASISLVRPDTTHVDSNETGWSARRGYSVNQYFAGEISYVDSGNADVSEDYTIPGGLFVIPSPFTLHYTARVKGPSLSLMGLLPLSSNASLFARGGILFADEKISQQFGDSLTFGDQVFIGGIGAQWSFNRRWNARLEYQRTGRIESNIAAGANRLDQLSLSVLFSL